jgi:hypothetical protein
MSKGTLVAGCLGGTGSIPGLALAAYVATAGGALAENIFTAPSNTSRMGTQSVITHSRDSIQRETPSKQQHSRRQPPPVKTDR